MNRPDTDPALPSISDAPCRALNVLVVDDHALVRAGYRRLLEMETDMRLVAECAQASDAQALLERHHAEVDVMVLDLSLPGRSGLDLLRSTTLNWPHVGVLVCSMHDSPGLVDQALSAGACGFVTKSSDPTLLPQAIRAVARGQRVMSPDIVHLEFPRSSSAPHDSLSPREFQVMLMLARGLSVETVAQELQLSAKRVSNVQTAIRTKLGAQSAVDMVRYVQAHRLMPD